MLLTNQKYILSCDIGGTHITSTIVMKSTWQILEDTITRTHLDSSLDAKSIFQSWASNIQNCMDKFQNPINQIGIAMPGPFDYDHGISLMMGQSKYDALYLLNTTKGIQDALKNDSLAIRYINDAAAFLQGEVYASYRENENITLGITLGTGLGSAVKQKDIKAFDADLWNEQYKDAIFEEYLATRWFTNRFYELKGIQENGLKEIIEKHKETPEFQLLLAEYRIQLKDFFDFFSSKYQSKNFIIGGNIAKAWYLINDHQTFKKYNITIGQYAEEAALIGAASLF